ncbi:hypothetical protein C8R46DRAFT_1048515 [Mycena filopes]|nr:hypothetical protein C8R46DRAFT_1048515 [Mycena filopes]
MIVFTEALWYAWYTALIFKGEGTFIQIANAIIVNHQGHDNLRVIFAVKSAASDVATTSKDVRRSNGSNGWTRSKTSGKTHYGLGIGIDTSRNWCRYVYRIWEEVRRTDTGTVVVVDRTLCGSLLTRARARLRKGKQERPRGKDMAEEKKVGYKPNLLPPGNHQHLQMIDTAFGSEAFVQHSDSIPLDPFKAEFWREICALNSRTRNHLGEWVGSPEVEAWNARNTQVYSNALNAHPDGTRIRFFPTMEEFLAVYNAPDSTCRTYQKTANKRRKASLPKDHRQADQEQSCAWASLGGSSSSYGAK